VRTPVLALALCLTSVAPAAPPPYGQRAAQLQQGPLADARTGYLAQVYTNRDVMHFLERARYASIVHTFGHGGSRFRECVTFWTGKDMEDPTKWTLLTETQERGNALGDASVWVAMRSAERQAIWRGMQLAVFVGCHTATNTTAQEATPAGWGSPAVGAVSLGTRTAVGFTAVIQSGTPRRPAAEAWDEQFWRELAAGNSVATAVRNASQLQGIDPSLKTAAIVGDGSLTTVPALPRAVLGGAP
jgi:hypothetical protein